MRIELKPFDQLTPSDRLGLERLSAEAFPPDDKNIVWSTNDFHVLVKEADDILCNVEIILRTATVGGQTVRLGGIGGVSTLKAWRRRGLAETAMKTAQAYLRDPLAVDFGLLICGETLVHYYGKLGWQLVAKQMWIEQPQGRLLFDSIIMILPVLQTAWPAGEIDLCGRPW